MITYSQLGNAGRLGNALFQLSTTLAQAEKLKRQALFPSSWKYKDTFPLLKDYFQDTLPNLETVSEKAFHYNELPLHDNINLTGYFQSYKYFSNIEKELRVILNIGGEIDHTKCFVHVRRGDYVNQQDYHPVQEPNYFHQAMDIIHNEYGISNFKFFSDDIPWCKQHFLGVDFSSGSSEIEDFKEMLSCGAGIISNSSFSWWAGYLINTGKVIAPRKWFGKNYAHYKTEDLYYPGWKII